MFFIDEPYVSDFFKKTVRDNSIPVVNTEAAKKFGLFSGTKLMGTDEALQVVRRQENPRLYMTSENSLDWIVKSGDLVNLREKISLFKDKLKFRELTHPLFPNFKFQEVRVENLKKVQPGELPFPFIIKPAVGFFSMGVYKVLRQEDWGKTAQSILTEIEQVKNLYPDEVLNTDLFIIEEIIEGEEYAIDAYYDSAGKPVILNIFKHIFSSDSDVSDRAYTTSKEIIEHNLREFTDFAEKIGGLAEVKNFPVHIELRRNRNGALLPIEINPLRFGGWCTTADLSFLAYGFNPYLCFYQQKKPDWTEILRKKNENLFSIIVLDNSTGLDADDITSFNYEKLLEHFEKPMELRKIDYKRYPVFGFLFTETRKDNFIEIKKILKSDLKCYIKTNKREEK